MIPTGHLSQADQGAEAAGVQGAAGRALRPRLPSPAPPWSPPCLHEGGLVGAGQGVADLPRPVNRRLAEPQRVSLSRKYSDSETFYKCNMRILYFTDFSFP